MTIADNIKRLRKNYNMSQEDLAKIAGVTVSAVSTWELGKREPRMGAIQKIADHFGLKKSDIIEDKISLSPPASEEFTQAEKGLVYAYREAPEPTKRIVDVALEPYKPGSNDAGDPIQLDEATRKDLKKAFDDGATKDRAMFKKKDEDTPVPSKPSIPIVTGTVKKEIPEYLDMVVNSEEELMLLIEKAYTGANTDKVKKLVRNVIEELSY